MRKKISLIGGGNIGGTIAYTIALKKLGDVVILDQDKEYTTGKSFDIRQVLPTVGQDISLIGTNDYSSLQNSDLVIITAGNKRKEGMSRDELLTTNINTIKIISQEVTKYCPNAFFIIVTNPLDAIVYAFLKYSAIPRKMVVGMSGTLDSARFISLLAEKLNISVNSINSLVIGGHDDTMLPLIRYTTVGGVPLEYFIKSGCISLTELQKIIDKTKGGGAEIIKLIKNGSAYYAPAASTIQIAESYLSNNKKLLPCSVNLQGEYGLDDICIGVPVIIGSDGVEKIIQIDLNKEEKLMFRKSVESAESLITKVKKVLK